MRFLQVQTPQEEEQVLFEIVHTVLPTIRRVVYRELARWQRTDPRHGGVPAEELDDVCAETVARLIRQLRDFRSHSPDPAIRNISHYAAAIAQNTVYAVLRRNRPELRILYDRIMYVLYGKYRNYGFAVWNGVFPGERVAGFQKWFGQSPKESDRYAEWRHHPERIAARWATDPAPSAIAHFFNYLFQWLNHPIRMTDLISGCMRIWSLRFTPPEMHVNDAHSVDTERESGRTKDYATFFQQLITEIRSLPLRQRRALLWHWSATDWCTIAAYAGCGLMEFAHILEIDEDDLYRTYRRLPLPDSEIAEQLGVTRQQVINLRKSALERLRRRLRSSSSITQW